MDLYVKYLIYLMFLVGVIVEEENLVCIFDLFQSLTIKTGQTC